MTIAETEGLSIDDRARLAAHWWQRAVGEMTSWVGFGHVLADLRAEGSPDFVVMLAQRAVADEYQHALGCRDLAVRFGHPGGGVRPTTLRPVTFDDATDEENRLLRITLSCLTETFGGFVLRALRPRLRDMELRRMNRRHMADELRHSQVGWAHLSTLDDRRRAVIRAFLPQLLSRLPTAQSDGNGAPLEHLVPFGYRTPQLVRAARDAALEQVILPSLAHVGLRVAA